MGENEGPSVVVSVVFAFLLPIVVFIASLAVFEEIFAGVINSEHIQMVLGLLAALIVTIIFVFIVKMFNRQSSQAG
ncbi:MAG: SoxR reducing system RseC family protein [Phycisphaerales bacterium]